MTPPRSLRRLFPYLLVVPILLGAEKNGCKKCDPTDAPPVDDRPIDDGPALDRTLQIVSMDPSSRDAGQSFDATLYGSGFLSGAGVKVGTTPASSVRVADANQLRFTVPILAAGSYDVTVINPDGREGTLRRALILRDPNAGVDVNQCRALTLYFELDSADLNADSKRRLDERAACLRVASGRIVLEGHADERGTTSYNLGLGQRRADVVARHLVAAGIPGTRLQTISYGEERPAVSGSDETAWARNRRVELHVD